MSLSPEEKALVGEALQVYIQLVSRQLPPNKTKEIAMVAQGILEKLDRLGAGGGDGRKGNKPAGITDEWYKKVCQKCDKLGPGGCTDKVTEKFPGKCDPILHYENEKAGIGKR
jgi:hypothetical protein